MSFRSGTRTSTLSEIQQRLALRFFPVLPRVLILELGTVNPLSQKP